MILKIILLLLFVSFVIMIFGVYLYDTYETTHDDCLITIAKKYCEEQGLIYNDIFRITDSIGGGYYSFSCFPDERSVEDEYFKFTDKEIKECRG